MYVCHIHMQWQFLGASAKMRKATPRLVMSVRPSACNNSALTGRIFMQFDIAEFFEYLSKKKNLRFTKIGQECRVFYTKTNIYFGHLSLNSS